MTPLSPRPLRSLRHRRRRAAALAGCTLALLALTTSAAGAHVRVHADSSAPGSFPALTFRVPTESETASTVEVAVLLPQDAPFLEVSTKPVPGWTVQVVEAALPKPVEFEGTTLTKAPRSITWTADDKASRIAPGQYQEFSVAAGPLPASGTLLMPATQTYSDGTVVRWDQPTPASGEEPEHPAPSLQIGAATGSDDHGGMMSPSVAASPSSGVASAAGAAPAAAPASVASTSDPLARVLAGGALVVAVGAAVAVLVGLRRRPGRP